MKHTFAGSDAFNFVKGHTFTWSRGRMVRKRWYHALAPSRLWRRLTWWRHLRSECVAIDIERGVVTYTSLRWSWLRWKWVRD